MRTRLLGLGGRTSAPPLLPYGKQEGSHESSKTHLTSQVATNLKQKSNSAEVLQRFPSRERKPVDVESERERGIKRKTTVVGGNRESTQSTERWFNNKIPLCDRPDRNQSFQRQRVKHASLDNMEQRRLIRMKVHF